MRLSEMLTVKTDTSFEQDNSRAGRSGEVSRKDGAEGILFEVFDVLNRAGIVYCVSHGYEDFQTGITSDVDCIIEAGVTSNRLLALFDRETARIDAEVVRCSEFLIVLSGKDGSGAQCFLTLDLSTDYKLDEITFYTGPQVLGTRRRYRNFWVPAVNIEFGCYLIRTITKGRWDEKRLRRLHELFQQDPAACTREIEQHWEGQNVALLIAASGSGVWGPVRLRLSDLQTELFRIARARNPRGFLYNKCRSQIMRLRRAWCPSGLQVVLLGPDGAGKSSTIVALESMLSGVFEHVECRGFAPPVLRILGADKHIRRTDQPHSLPPRSLLISVVRAGYWFLYQTVGHASLQVAVARSTLVLNDRHFVDIFVDARRYRYGGPVWLLRLIWWLIPKPNLVILLDAPAEILHRRKQEVSFEESTRQREAYLSLVQGLPNGHVVDAARPLQQVSKVVSEIIVRHLAIRTARRHGFRKPSF